jgi:outer membrane protein OmpU
MTNIKKLGLTALAGSLVATSAYAGALDVSGGVSLKWSSEHETEHTQNNYTMGQGVNFAGSGDIDSIGAAMTYNYLMTNAAFSSSNVKLDFGDMGSIAFSEGGNPGGIGAWKDKMPSAGEEVYDDMDGEANGVTTFPTNGTFGYNGSFGPIDISVGYNKNSSASSITAATISGNSDTRTITTNDGSSVSYVVSGSPVEGATLFYGFGEKAGTDRNSGTDMWTAGVTYATGNVTMGIQQSATDVSAANGDNDRLHLALNYQVNDDMAISYGMSTVEFENGTLTDQEDAGVSISYSMGSMSITGNWLTSDNVGGANGTDDSHNEIVLAFSF